MRKGLIIGSGHLENLQLLCEEAIKHDFVICADGGVRYAVQARIHVDLVVGDFDSISKEEIFYVNQNNIPIIKYPIEKDATDLELAIDYLVENDYNAITLIGVTGNRLDHTLANIFLLKSIFKRNISGRIIDDNNRIYYLEKTLEISKSNMSYLSVIPLSEDGIIVSLFGFYYPLNHKYIEFGSTLGISNEIVKDYGIVELHKGQALVIESKD